MVGHRRREARSNVIVGRFRRLAAVQLGAAALAGGAAMGAGAAPGALAGGAAALLAGVGAAILLRSVRTVRRLEEQVRAGERRDAALDRVSSNIMIADAELHIRYVTPALRESLARSRAFWSAQPNGPDVRQLEGVSIDVFHREPGRIRERLARLEGEFSCELGFDGRRFSLRVMAMEDGAGRRSGYVVEWTERTEALRASDEIAQVIAAVGTGDFSRRLQPETFDEGAREVAAAVNSICGTVAGFIDETEIALCALAEGDLVHRTPANGEGRFRDLAIAANGAFERVAGFVGQIRQAGDALAGAAERMGESSSELSGRAESQAASLEETAATMEQMAASVRSNADSAESSDALAADARGRAESGRAVVGEAVSAMDRIEESARKIAEITSLIDSIAFQTNLLALNASVEAARAGEAGKGFAVVASEVRLLAQRSAEAARDIKQLIQESSEHVGSGVELVRRTDEALGAIGSVVSELSAKVAEIAAATREQSAGLQEISAAVANMDELTQRNAGLAENSAASARELGEQTRRLDALVGAFRIEERGAEGWRRAAE